MIRPPPPPPPPPPEELGDTFYRFLDRRHADLFPPLFAGFPLAHGRCTATAWFRAGSIADDFRRAYTPSGTIGRSNIDAFATAFCCHLRHRPRATLVVRPG